MAVGAVTTSAAACTAAAVLSAATVYKHGGRGVHGGRHDDGRRVETVTDTRRPFSRWPLCPRRTPLAGRSFAATLMSIFRCLTKEVPGIFTPVLRAELQDR